MTRGREDSESVTDLSVDRERRRDELHGRGGRASVGASLPRRRLLDCRRDSKRRSPAVFRVRWSALRPAQATPRTEEPSPRATTTANRQRACSRAGSCRPPQASVCRPPALNTPASSTRYSSLGSTPSQVSSCQAGRDRVAPINLPWGSGVVLGILVVRKPVRSSFKLQASIAQAHHPSGLVNCLQAHGVLFNYKKPVPNLPRPPSFCLLAPRLKPKVGCLNVFMTLRVVVDTFIVSIHSVSHYLNPTTLFPHLRALTGRVVIAAVRPFISMMPKTCKTTSPARSLSEQTGTFPQSR